MNYKKNIRRVIATGVASVALIAPMAMSGVNSVHANADDIFTPEVEKVSKQSEKQDAKKMAQEDAKLKAEDPTGGEQTISPNNPMRKDYHPVHHHNNEKANVSKRAEKRTSVKHDAKRVHALKQHKQVAEKHSKKESIQQQINSVKKQMRNEKRQIRHLTHLIKINK